MSYLAEIAPGDARLGGKARSLGVLAAAGLPTPMGFVVTDRVFRALCPEVPSGARLDIALVEALDRCRARIERAPWPDAFLDELHARLARLGATRFAVRSSFAAEDRPGSLAAGVYESRVDVPAEAVPQALREVLASALAPGAVAYALAHRLDPAAGPFAVLVHAFGRGEAEGSAAVAMPGSAILTVRRGELAASCRAELESTVTALGQAQGPVEIEWFVAEGRLVYLQARPFEPPPPPTAWEGWSDLRPGDPPPSAWRWDAAHNPWPLSPAQAGLVELVDGVCRIGIRQRVLGGYLFYAKDEGPLATAIAPSEAAAYYDRLRATVEASPAALAARPGLEAALALFVATYEPIFGVLQPALRAAHAGLREFLAVHAPAQLPRLPVLRSGVASVASERLARSEKLAVATPEQRQAALTEYLARFGDEAPAWDVAEPTYAEAPDALVPQPRGPSPSADWREASDAVAASLPAELRAAWFAALELARTAVALGEADDWLFAKTEAVVRRALLGEGQRLTAQGLLARPDDVFFLPLGEVRRWASGAVPAPGLATRAAAARARGEQARNAPPPALGGGEAEAIRGIGVGGRAIGRVARHCAGRACDPRAVLVAKTLLPTELPLLDAAALVVETGGPLDHVAAQARERKLPAVVGAANALAHLRDGDLVLVDGDRGWIVRL